MPPEMQEIIDDFSLFDDWEDKYAYLIDLGRKLEPLDERYKTEENKVRGCTSQVWLITANKPEEPGKLYFLADSDAHIVKGLIAILLKIFSGKTPEEIRKIDIEAFFAQLGLKQYLTPNRTNGFFSMVKKIQDLARTK